MQEISPKALAFMCLYAMHMCHFIPCGVRGVDMQSLAHHVVRNVFGTMYMGYQLLHARFSVFMMCNSTFQMHISPCTHAQYLSTLQCVVHMCNPQSLN